MSLRSVRNIRRSVPVSPVSYIIYKDSAGIIHAKNGLTGEIEFSGDDAATVIQNTINKLEKGGKIVLIGSFELQKSLIISKDSIWLSGIGKGIVSSRPEATILRFTQTDSSHGITATSVGRIKISDMTIIGNTNAGDGIHLTSCNGEISNVIVDDFGGNGIYMKDCYYFSVYNVWTRSNGQHGVHLDNCNSIIFVCLKTSDNGKSGVYTIAQDGGGLIDIVSEFNEEAGITIDCCRGIGISHSYFENNKQRAIYICNGSCGLAITQSVIVGRIDAPGLDVINVADGNNIIFFGNSIGDKNGETHFVLSSEAVGIIDFMNHHYGTGTVWDNSGLSNLRISEVSSFQSIKFSECNVWFDNRIYMDEKDYIEYDKSNDRYVFYINNTAVGYIDSTGFHSGAPT